MFIVYLFDLSMNVQKCYLCDAQKKNENKIENIIEIKVKSKQIG